MWELQDVRDANVHSKSLFDYPLKAIAASGYSCSLHFDVITEKTKYSLFHNGSFKEQVPQNSKVWNRIQFVS